MPCSQMISMNIRPPRATAERKLESVPNVNARIRNSGSRNIGSGDPALDHGEGDQQRDAGAEQRRSPAGSPSPSAWPP